VHRDGRVAAGYQYVDGIVGDIGPGVLRDRSTLAAEGVVVIIVLIDAVTGAVVTGPEIVTRGWVHAPSSEPLLDEVCDRLRETLETAFVQGVRDPIALERELRRAAGRLVHDATGRRPMIVPVVMEA
jgi:ribonuclease J